MVLNLSKFESNVKLLLEANNKPNKIAILLKKDIKSIYNTINRISKKKEVRKEVKNIRNTRITKREKRVIKRDIIRSHKKINKRLIVENNLGFTKRSLQRVLKEVGATTNIATKKPLIKAKLAKLRLIYAKE